MAKNTICLWYDKDAEAAAQFYAETAATNPSFKKILESMNNFAANGYQWFQVAELGYDSFMARNPQG